jgi:hypothetical protein
VSVGWRLPFGFCVGSAGHREDGRIIVEADGAHSVVTQKRHIHERQAFVVLGLDQRRRTGQNLHEVDARRVLCATPRRAKPNQTATNSKHQTSRHIMRWAKRRGCGCTSERDAEAGRRPRHRLHPTGGGRIDLHQHFTELVLIRPNLTESVVLSVTRPHPRSQPQHSVREQTQIITRCAASSMTRRREAKGRAAPQQSRAEQSRAEQSRAEQSRAEQSRAEQSRAEQGVGMA